MVEILDGGGVLEDEDWRWWIEDVGGQERERDCDWLADARVVLNLSCIEEVVVRIEGQLERLEGSGCSDVHSLVLLYWFERSMSPLLHAGSHAEGLVWDSERDSDTAAAPVDSGGEDEENGLESVAADTAAAPADSAGDDE